MDRGGQAAENRPSTRGRRRCCCHNWCHRDPIRGGARRAKKRTCKEEEIQTLSQVLAAKEKHLAEIKRKLGINSLQELKQNIAKGWQDVTATSAYKKTSETLSQAGQKASAAFSSVGSVITKKLEDVNIRSIQHSISMPAMRNSPTFKSFEEKVENLKAITQRERGRDTGRGRSRLHALGARHGIRSRVSRIAPWAKGRRQTAAPPSLK
uniref:Tumor protein D52 n=1 Tax=Canis lupus familiaris TaxID=9615 RepID=A0A8I3RY57_CANLF